MAEFITEHDADCKYGSKNRTNAALTLGIIGTALGAFNNNGGCCGNNGGILGNLFGGNNNCCCLAERAMQMAQQKTQPILDEINREVGSLSVDEQNVLAKTQEYQMAKQTYEAGFMAFLGNKFSQEFVASPDGKVAAENLLATIRKSKAHIQSQIKAKEEKVNTLLELMESDPEMKRDLMNSC